MFEVLLDWLFPPGCPGCQTPGTGDFCARCARWLVPRSQPTPGGLVVHAAGPYEGPLRRALLDLKHGGRTCVVPALARAMARALPSLRPGALVAVPGTPERLRYRGFHGPGRLAALLALHLEVPVRPELLVPARPLPSQRNLSRAEREENVRGGFRAGPVQGLEILLVDDVMSTGATLEEAARTLRRAGARRVEAVVAAAVRPGGSP